MSIRVEKIVPGGQGLATLPDGKKFFLWNALPGEEIAEFEIMKTRTKYFEGIVTEVKTPSKDRVEPKDACFLSTSPWQMMTYYFELRTKTEIVQEVFRQNGFEIEAPEIMTDGREWNYRNKMEYSLYWDKEQKKISPAFHQRGSHRKIPIASSSIERVEIYETATKIISDLNHRGEEARKYQSLLLRTAQDGTVSGGLYENGKPHPVFPPLSDKILGVPYTYSPNGFFQINLPVYELALEEIAKEIDEAEQVLDLYAGVGTIGLSVARGRELTLVECNKDAFRELEKNCEVATSWDYISSSRVHNAPRHLYNGQSEISGRAESPAISVTAVKITEGYSHAQKKYNPKKIIPVLAKSEEALDYIKTEMTVILDPPRSGCDKKLLEKLLEVKPRKIVYLSCDPATQARDVAILAEKYIIRRIKSFNFFPKTPHIENLVVLEISQDE